MRDRARLRDRLLDMAAALVGRRDAAANIEHAVDDRLRATLASIFGFEDVPPDSYIEQAARHHVARIAMLGQRWLECSRRLKDSSAENVRLAFEADELRRRLTDALARVVERADALHQLAEREHQLATAREKLRSGDVQGAEHYLWTVTRADSAIEVGGLQHPGMLGGEEVGDVG